MMKLKGEIDPELAIDLSNKATLAFLQRHLGKKIHSVNLSLGLKLHISKVLLGFAGLEKNFNQWDPLIDGQDENLIQGTNISVLQSAI